MFLKEKANRSYFTVFIITTGNKSTVKSPICVQIPVKFTLWSLTTSTYIMNNSRLLLPQRTVVCHGWFFQPTLCFANVFMKLLFAVLQACNNLAHWFTQSNVTM